MKSKAPLLADPEFAPSEAQFEEIAQAALKTVRAHAAEAAEREKFNRQHEADSR